MINYKRIMAAGLAATMVMGSSVVAFAADQEASSNGEGETQYVEVNDIFDVVFPTVAENATTFDYLLDPNGLIAKTNGDRYTGKAFDDDKKVYFLRSSKVDGTVGGTAGTANCDYTNKSDEIKVINKSTEAVDLKVSAKVVDVPEEIKMAAASTFTGTDTELYLGLIGTDGTTPIEKAITADGVELTANIAEDPNAYEVTWQAASGDTPGRYVKSLTAAAQAAGYTGFKTYSFQLTGDCNTTTGTDWSGLTDKAPKVDLTWSVKDFTVTGPQVTVSNTGLITISGMEAGKLYKSMAITNKNGGPYNISIAPATWNMDNYNTTTGGSFTCQLGEAWLSTVRGTTGKVTVTFSDNTTVEVAINIPEA